MYKDTDGEWRILFELRPEGDPDRSSLWSTRVADSHEMALALG
jgi:hypothetical protein